MRGFSFVFFIFTLFGVGSRAVSEKASDGQFPYPGASPFTLGTSDYDREVEELFPSTESTSENDSTEPENESSPSKAPSSENMGDSNIKNVLNYLQDEKSEGVMDETNIYRNEEVPSSPPSGFFKLLDDRQRRIERLHRLYLKREESDRRRLMKEFDEYNSEWIKYKPEIYYPESYPSCPPCPCSIEESPLARSFVSNQGDEDDDNLTVSTKYVYGVPLPNKRYLKPLSYSKNSRKRRHAENYYGGTNDYYGNNYYGNGDDYWYNTGPVNYDLLERNLALQAKRHIERTLYQYPLHFGRIRTGKGYKFGGKHADFRFPKDLGAFSRLPVH